MASQSTGGGPHGGQAGNSPEQVFCHACGNQWTKDDRGLICPRCDSEATEIMTPESNVREFYDFPESSSSSDHQTRLRHRYSSDSDPDEADIEEILRGGRPPNASMRSNDWPGRDDDSPGPFPRYPPGVNDGDQIMDRFYQMLGAFGGLPRPSNTNRPDMPAQNQGWGQPRQFGEGAFGTAGRGGNVRTFTSRTGNGFTSFTIATGPIHINAGGNSRQGARGGGHQQPDDFNSVFGNILGGAVPPQGAGAGADGEGARGQPPNLAASLAQLLSLLAPGNGQYGDAVYTQEALDRIVSAMMEQNPQSNAAPPASEDAINKLEKKAVDEEMLGPEGKAECTICIEELKKGDIVVYLPCKHWFHEECANMWLREHNTCPICRSPIEERNNDNAQGGGARPGAGAGAGAGPEMPGGPGTPGAGSQDFSPPPYPPPGHGGPPPGGQGSSWGGTQARAPLDTFTTRPGATTQTWRWSFTYPPRPAGQPQNFERSSGRMPSGYSINLNGSRRNSQSPPAQAAGSRTRQRSPTPSSWDRARGQQEPDQQQQGSGPWSWLRNQFSRGSSSGDRPHDNRRQ